MKKPLLTLLLLTLLAWCGSIPAGAAGEADCVGSLSRLLKAPESETPYMTQCEMGCAAADAVREFAGTELAVVSAADLTGGLAAGPVTRSDIQGVFSQDRPLAAAEITPAYLFELLETAVSHIVLDTDTELIEEGSEVYGGFCQISGFRFQYDVSAPVGKRVLKVVMEDGAELSRTDGETELSLAAPAYLLEGAYGLPETERQPAEGTLAQALEAYLAGRTALPEGEGERIEYVGARNRSIVSIFPRWALTGGVAVLIVLLAFYRMRYNKIKDEYATS